MSEVEVLYKIVEELICPKCDASTGIEFDNEGEYVMCWDCDFEGHASEFDKEGRVVDNG